MKPARIRAIFLRTFEPAPGYRTAEETLPTVYLQDLQRHEGAVRLITTSMFSVAAWRSPACIAPRKLESGRNGDKRPKSQGPLGGDVR